ncbi:hypothetical protein E2562_017291 [Oryza meyeriana var. granulata]|uniref:Aminotransferase class V domain-containing protein n=1 Tax=Oryza meyeriana var. granulata TaxID=110450 RepID=A0A6G1EM76_9ORYZ|nr:hypothetical protein E2562_017291 [Oryza meyeriana var. granulata]
MRWRPAASLSMWTMTPPFDRAHPLIEHADAVSLPSPIGCSLQPKGQRISCTAVATPAPSSSASAATDRGVYNFAAGPATLPLTVLQKAQAKLVDYRNLGMSIMEMSHRGKEFDAAIKKAEADLRALLAVLDTHEVLFLHGGATTHFAAVPLNLCASPSDPIYFVVFGSWSFKAFKEAKKFSSASVACFGKDVKYTSLPPFDAIKQNSEARRMGFEVISDSADVQKNV